MRKFFLVLALALAGTAAQAQRLAFVDVSAIMDAVPEYKTAQQEIDRVSEQWKQDIQREYQKIDEMYRKFQADQVFLNESDRKRREEEIVQKEKDVREMQKQKFGPEGELTKKRQALVKPIQERVYKAINLYAQEKGLDFIFDKGSAGLLFANDSYDKTQDIIKKLGQ
jgi:outer membrane protein